MLLLGTLLPWASLMGISVGGSDTDDGKLMLILVGVVAIAAVLARRRPNAAQVIGLIGYALALAMGIYEIHHITSRSLMGMHPSVGSGLWIVVVGSVIGLVGSFLPTSKKVSV
jgi:hypothetical protein